MLYEVVGEHSLHLSTVGEMIVGTGCYISGGTLPSLVDSGGDDGRYRVLYEVVGEHSLHLSTVGEMIVGTGCYMRLVGEHSLHLSTVEEMMVGTGCYMRLWGNTPFTCRQWGR